MASFLSKSTFMYGCQCPKRLYLHKKRPELADPYDEQAMAIFARGTNVGILAQERFPGGVDAQGDDPYPGFEAAKRTQAYLQAGHEVIYEATFVYRNTLCAVDILVKTAEGWAAFEVKSTNSAKAQHAQDAALQYYVLQGAGMPVERFYILHFNNTYVRRGEIDVQELFAATQVTKKCVELQSWVDTQVGELHKMLDKGKEPNLAMGTQCNSPYACNFQGYCSSLIAEETQSVTSPFNTRIHFIDAKIQTFLSSFQYPLYFFDFETVMYGVPEYDESRPYQQLPFQYSLHVIEAPGEEVKHLEYLAEAGSDPREGIIQAMLRDLGTTGTILAWYKSFECGRIKELARDFPSYETELLALLDRVDDLMIPFQSGWVNSEAFGGSSSIKNVLPVMVPELSYDALEIKEGNTASFQYSQLASMPPDTAQQTREALLAYCKLDTLAMVRIWEKLLEESMDHGR
ncbi:MAG: DUF2779 domain-containing protein [Bacteroidetes bacterium]|nr:MAG: DUF2779 domain-containing protein [Bacteroidota bacterium]